VDKDSKRLVGTLLDNKIFDLPLPTQMALAGYAITRRQFLLGLSRRKEYVTCDKRGRYNEASRIEVDDKGQARDRTRESE
jgi:hypothetical protein